MRVALYLAAAILGGVIALFGEEPIWFAAVAAVLIFPIAAATADRRSTADRGSRPAPLLPALLTALAGGLLIVILARLAIAAPDWISKAGVDCGGPSEGAQRLVLFSAALIFVASSAPVAITMVQIGARLSPGRPTNAAPVPIGFYPLAVAASGLALIAAGYVTNC